MTATPSRNMGRGLRTAFAVLAALVLPAAVRAQAVVTGKVTAQGQPLVDARVLVRGTSLTATTNAAGDYTIRNVPTGAQAIEVLRVGYRAQTANATFAAGETKTVNIAMEAAIVQLQDVVTTATGEQRRVELGNAISTLGDVAKKVETSPVTNMQDLLVAKAPGVNILPGNMTGSAGQIHIRGVNSLSLNNNPIWIVDGVRFNAGSVNVGVGGTSTSFLNSLDPEEIEDVEIVKGPSAATLYGTDAANGVVVITTKKGRAGAAKWTFFGEGGLVEDKNKYPTAYMEWGHNAAGSTTRCLNYTIGVSCTMDSLSSLNVLRTSGLTPLANGHRDQYGAQVSGGSDAVRYFVSGDLENELGPVKMPAHDIATFDSLNIPVRDEWIHPEALQRQSVRANLNAAVNPKFDLSINTAFTKSNQRLPEVDNNFFSIYYQSMMSPGFIGAGPGTTGVGTRGESLYGNNGYNYGDIMQVYTEEDIQRTLGSLTANWRPYAWMTNEGTVGIDLADRQDPFICRFNECPDQGDLRLGSVGDQTSNDRNFSAKAVSNMTWQARQWMNLKTSVGGDYTNIESDYSFANGNNLPPGAQTVDAAAVQSGGNRLMTAVKTLGLYVQEQAGIRDRLFITGAVRTDQNSAFGTNFQRVFYPKVSASWIASDESFFPKYNWLNQFRLRTAYGASGVQPRPTSALQTVATTTVNVENVDTPGLRASALGNPDLKPETSAELEAGFDSRMFNDRVNFEFTYYNKKTRDALISQPLAPSSAASGGNNSVTSVLRNLGSVQNSGVEVTLNSTILDTRRLGWDITVSASHNSNKIVSLGTDAQGNPNPAIFVNSSGSLRDSVGLPVNAYIYRPFTYSDVNGDGYIQQNEVTVGQNYEYRGYSLPRDLVSIQNGFDLFSRKLRLQALVDYKGGNSLYNNTLAFQCQQSPRPCYDVSNPDASLYRQARVVAQNLGTRYDASGKVVTSGGTVFTTAGGFVENAQFWRLREVSATLTLPQSVAARIRAQDAGITFSARNLKLWTNYTGADPESNYSTGDTQADFATTAPPRYFIVRLNLHY